MQFSILRDFIPWILFSALYGQSNHQMMIAILVSGAVFIKIEMHHLKNGFMLSWGTAIFFVFMALCVVLKIQWAIDHGMLLSNVALAIIAWASLIVGKPFTLQYARETTPKQIWTKPGFIQVNKILTSVWGAVFIISALLYLVPTGSTRLDKSIYQLLMFGSLVFAIWFTKIFPKWYSDRNKKNNIANNHDLQGNFAPVLDECDVYNLSITGNIPHDLNGVYMRNGPNPLFPPVNYTYPFDGDGMIHAVYLKDGKANYRNRFIKTKGLLLEQKFGRGIYSSITLPIPPDSTLIGPNDDPGPVKNGAFIHIIHHANHYLAMSETDPAYEIDEDLNTLGEWHAGMAKPLATSPHTRLDPDTNELFLINYDIHAPYLVCYQVNNHGVLTNTKIIDKPYSTMMHDFAMTKNYLIFFDCPAVLDIKAANAGNDVLQWRPELGTRIGIMSRHNDNIIWINTEAFFVFHFVNAFEDENSNIIIDYVRHNRLGFGIKNNEPKYPPKLYRMIINMNDQSIVDTILHDYSTEFPTFNQRYNTKKYQYIYSLIKFCGNEFDALAKYDLKNNITTIHDFGENFEISEATFASTQQGIAEDDGYLMLFAYDKIKNKSDLVILDARNISNAPIAKIEIPRRVPHGLHGNWFDNT